MRLDIVDLGMKKVGDVELSPKVFEREVKEGLLGEAVLSHMASRRAGTSSTKRRSEVSGGGKKPWKQKGLGRARVGSSRSPLWRGGGSVFGPKPRDFSYQLPKSARKAALATALTQMVKDNALIVVDKVALAAPKTKAAIEALKALGVYGAKVLMVVEHMDAAAKLGFRNIPAVKMVEEGALNVYDLLNASRVIMDREALGKLQDRLSR